MLVCKILWVKFDKQHWEGEETDKKEKNQRSVEVSQLFLSETVASRSVLKNAVNQAMAEQPHTSLRI